MPSLRTLEIRFVVSSKAVTGPEEGLHLYVHGGLPLNTADCSERIGFHLSVHHTSEEEDGTVWCPTSSVLTLQTFSCACTMESWHVNTLNLESPKIARWWVIHANTLQKAAILSKMLWRRRGFPGKNVFLSTKCKLFPIVLSFELCVGLPFAQTTSSCTFALHAHPLPWCPAQHLPPRHWSCFRHLAFSLFLISCREEGILCLAVLVSILFDFA